LEKKRLRELAYTAKFKKHTLNQPKSKILMKNKMKMQIENCAPDVSLKTAYTTQFALRMFLGLFCAVIFVCLPSLAEIPSVPSSNKAALKLFSNQFVSQHYDRTGRRDYQILAGDFSNNDATNGFNIDIQGGIAPSATILNYVNIKEAYFKSNSLRLGRVKSNWSVLDESYSLGIFQPQFRWNPLTPESQGLTGMLWSLSSISNNQTKGFEIFVSPFFIPDQLPNFEVDERGQFVESNPYFRTPPRQVSLNGTPVPFAFDLLKPPVDQIVLNSSFAARIFWGEPDAGFFANLSYAYKPANQIMIGVHASELKINLVSGDSSPVTVAPKVWYHSLVASDLSWTRKSWKMGASLIYESPENPEFPSQFSRFEYDPALLWSPYVRFVDSSLEFTFSYLGIQTNKPQTKTSMRNRELYSKVLFPRLFHSEAYLASVSYGWLLEKKQALSFKAQWLRGAVDDFNLLKVGITYDFRNKYSFFMNSELINVSDDLESSQVALKTYRDNDSTSLGVSYVF
jgi:hypothetical protein